MKRTMVAVVLASGAWLSFGCASRQKVASRGDGKEVAAAHPTPPPGTLHPQLADVSDGQQHLYFDPIHFELDSTQIAPDSRAILDKVAEALRKDSKLRLTLSGHTCELGTSEYNLALGQQRAAVARQYLVRLGVTPERIEVVSYGEERPVASGAGAERLAQNRRAEFALAHGP